MTTAMNLDIFEKKGNLGERSDNKN